MEPFEEPLGNMTPGELYIVMCERADDIQKVDLNGVKYPIIISASKDKVSWIPTQDQLQDMVQGKDDITPIGVLFSMEKLWLVFVMCEKYQKRWDGTGWVKPSLLPEV